ncbi:MAG TPA: cellulose binding domain-containing protein [Acetivibrio sp.]|nr:cellulose binding domain-containing protein [Acetivibrio sp.]
MKGKKSIIVTETGLFEEINTREGMFIGQKIIYSQQDIIQNRRIDINYIYPVIASIAAVFVLLFSYFKLFYSDAPFAYVDIDINPSIEFEVDNKGIILREQPLNQEAIEIMNGVTYEDKHLEDAIIDLIKKSKEYGYLKEDEGKDIILISAAIDIRKKINDNDNRIINELVNNLRSDFIRLNQDIDIRFVEVSADLRKRAAENEVSMGKYLIYEKVLQEGKYISLEMLAQTSLEELLNEYDVDLYGFTEPANTFQPSPSGNIYEATPKEEEKTTPTEKKEPLPTPTEKIKLTPTPTEIIKSVPTPTKEILPTPKEKTEPTPTLTKEYEPTPTPTKRYESTPTPTKEYEPTPTPTKKYEQTPTPTKRYEPTPTPTKKYETTPTPTKRYEPTPTPTEKIKSTPTPTKISKPTPTQASGGKQGVKVQFYSNNEVSPATTIFLRIRVENTGDTALDLSDIKLRYYYTIDGYSDQVFTCDWSSVGAHNVTGRFVKISPSRSGADTFLEIGFGNNSGMLEPGSSIDMNIRYTKSDNTEYNHEDDYSFKSTNYVYEDWDKITAYISGVLKWGREP